MDYTQYQIAYWKAVCERGAVDMSDDLDLDGQALPVDKDLKIEALEAYAEDVTEALSEIEVELKAIYETAREIKSIDHSQNGHAAGSIWRLANVIHNKAGNLLRKHYS